MPVEKRKHGDLSSVSDMDTSVNSPVKSSTSESDKKSKSQKKKEMKKSRTEKEVTASAANEESREEKETETLTKTTNVQDEISQINKKLSQMITKDDNSFMKQLIKDAFVEQSFMKQVIKDIFIEIKDTLLESVTKKIETIEGEIHDMAVENVNLKTELRKLTKQIEEKNDTIERLERKNEKEKTENAEILNEQEQYSRRNNIRIVRLPEDNVNEKSVETTEKVVKLLKHKLDLDVSKSDIDIAHRLGQYRSKEKPRPVIVKLVRRQTKIDIMTNKKKLKGSKIFLSEDLTKLNNEVLASTRKKLPDEVERSWSIDGKISIKWKADASIERLKFADYQKWLDLPWPK